MTIAQQMTEEIKKNKIIAIVRGVSANDICNLADALYAGGIRMMEVTFDHTSPEGMQNTLESIRLLTETRADHMYIGAGTVLSADQVQAVHYAGGQFIITPNVNADVITQAKRLDMAVMCGAYTATEIEYAYRMGADIVKIFPIVTAGPAYVKALRGPLGYIPLAAVGGVDADNIADFFRAGCCSAGVGGSLVNKKAIAEGSYDLITDYAKRLIEAVREF